VDYYLLAFMLIVFAGSVLVYSYYLKEKKEQLDSIKRGFCPKCKQDTIELLDQHTDGFCGPKILSFACTNCDYTNSFSI